MCIQILAPTDGAGMTDCSLWLPPQFPNRLWGIACQFHASDSAQRGNLLVEFSQTGPRQRSSCCKGGVQNGPFALLPSRRIGPRKTVTGGLSATPGANGEALRAMSAVRARRPSPGTPRLLPYRLRHIPKCRGIDARGLLAREPRLVFQDRGTKDARP